jgi:2,4-dienoyl-CoA reductase (NADPH2)
MHVGLEEEFGPLKKMAAYLARRAEGGVGLIVTGGVAPSWEGWTKPFGAKLANRYEAWKHRYVTDAVHEAGGRICMQILHTGRYAFHPFPVAPSAIKSPISPFKPRALSGRAVRRTIQDFANCAALAQRAGYDGVEIMGSEGYLLNQFLVTRTNQRQDEWGGDYSQRMRFPLEVVRAVREAVGPEFVLIFRLSMIDLVDQGSSWDEVLELARRLEEVGVTMLNTGIGWHEARIPTIATGVPRAGFTWVTKRLAGQVSVPLITSNRINLPEDAERVLKEGCADMVSMARPFLADPDWVRKAEEDRAEEVNACIACNQACLDHIFQGKRCSCLVNPAACHEEEPEWRETPVHEARHFGVVGAGLAGLSFATTAARRGHSVTLFEAENEVGGQFNLARQVPGKSEFTSTLDYFRHQVELTGVELKLGHRVTSEELLEGQYDDVILSSGVRPREVQIEGIEHDKVVSYPQVLRGEVEIGKRVAILGAGGIGFDVAEYLAHQGLATEFDTGAFMREWGVDQTLSVRGGLQAPEETPSARQIFLCQRSPGKLGARLGKTTGWIHRAALKKKKVEMLAGCRYLKIDDQGLHLEVDGKARLLDVDHVVICAGQVSEQGLRLPLEQAGLSTFLIGGASQAGKLDAKRAISEGRRLANRL